MTNYISKGGDFVDEDDADDNGNDTFTKMDSDEFRNALSQLLSDAEAYVEQTLAPERIAAQRIYDSEDYGHEVEGRSKVHSSDVRDAILSKIPSFMRVLCGSQKICEVVPMDETEVIRSEEMSDTIDFFFNVKNDGFSTVHSAIHDAELKKAGVITWWKEEKTRVLPATYTGFSQEMIDLFLKQPDIEFVDQTEEDPTPPTMTSNQANPLHSAPNPSMMAAAMGGYGAPTPDALKTYTLRVLSTVKDLEFKVAAVPPEELLLSRDARNETHNSLIGRRRDMTLGELVSLGYDAEEILEHSDGNGSGSTMFDQEQYARTPALMQPQHTTSDPSLRKVPYYEVYHRVDKDGRGAAPLRRTCLIGTAHHVIYDEVADEQDFPPFAILCGTPIPHAAIGLSTVDQVAELQILKTSILRNTMDSLANSIWPKTAFDSTKVNVDDLMNSESGALVRVQGQPSASIQEMTSTFVGAQALSVLSYIDNIKQSRLGVGDGTSLKGDELQSTTAVAAAAIVGQGQDRLELEARHYAEGLKKVFKGLLRLIIRHADGPLPIRTRDGQFQQIDPRTWNPDADVRIITALGKGSEQQNIALLQQVLSVQSNIFTQFGMNQPLVGVAEYRNTLEDLCLAMGKPTVSRYFKKVDPNWAPPAPPNQQMLDPMVLQAQATALQAQVAQSKAANEHMIALEKTRNDATQAAAQLAQDRYLKELEIQAKYGTTINQAAVDAAVEHTRIQRDSEVSSALGMAELQHKAQQADLDRSADMMNQALTQSQAATPAAPTTPGQQNKPNVSVNVQAPSSAASAPAPAPKPQG